MRNISIFSAVCRGVKDDKVVFRLGYYNFKVGRVLNAVFNVKRIVFSIFAKSYGKRELRGGWLNGMLFEP